MVYNAKHCQVKAIYRPVLKTKTENDSQYFVVAQRSYENYSKLLMKKEKDFRKRITLGKAIQN